jgi:hypothetical protein
MKEVYKLMLSAWQKLFKHNLKLLYWIQGPTMAKVLDPRPAMAKVLDPRPAMAKVLDQRPAMAKVLDPRPHDYILWM